MAVSAKDLELVRADITIGLSAMHDKDNPIMIGMAAYHFSQAIEKSVKAVIREKATEPVSQDTMYAHNMEHLLLQAERFSAGFIQKHPFIADNAFTLSAFNGMRYGNKTISKPDVYILMKNAKNLLYELENAYMQEHHVGKEEIHQHAKIQMKEAGKIYLNDKNSNWKKSFPHKENPDKTEHSKKKHRDDKEYGK